MADSISRNVKVTIDVTTKGTNIDSLSGKFENIAQAVDNATASVSGFVKALSEIKAPPAINNIVESLKQIKNVGTLPNVKNIADGFAKLKDIKVAPDLSTFVKELEKFKGITIPAGFNSFIEALKKLKGLDIGGPVQKIGLLADAMKLFKDSSFPGVTSFVNGMAALGKLRITPITDKIKRLVKQISELANTTYMQTFQKFASDLNKVGSAFDKLSPKAAKARAAVISLQGAVKQTTSKFGDLLTMMKRYLTYRSMSLITQSISEAFWGAITAITAYSQALKDLQAITTATDDEVSLMGKAIRETSSDTKFLATEVAEGMKILGQAGLSAAEASSVIGDVANLATGTLSSMASAVDLTTTTMRVFNIAASESQRIVDTFANAVNNSKLTIDKIATSFNYIGPIARDVGLSFEETNAALASLANSGLRASTMGTGLRRILAELASPSEKFKDAAKSAGVALQTLDPASNSLSNVLANLQDVIVDTDTAFELFGKRGAAAALALTSSTNSYDDMLDKISKSGTAASMAATQMEGLDIAFKKVLGKAQLLAIAIGEAGLTKALSILAKALQWVLDLAVELANNALGKFILQATALASSVVILTVAFKGLAGAIAFARTGMTLYVSGAAALTASNKVALASVTKLATAFKALNLSLGWIAVIAVGLVALYKGYKYLTTGAKNSAKEQRALSESFKGLSTEIDTYKENIDGLDESSDKYRETNLALRKSIGDTASEFSVLTVEALAASNSIDPVTGALEDGGVALDAYNEKLKDLRFNSFILSMEKAEKATKDTSGTLGTFVSGFTDFSSNLLQISRASLVSMSTMAGLRDENDKLAESYWDLTGASIKSSAGISVINHALADGTASYEDLQLAAEKFKNSGLAGSVPLFEKYNSVTQDAVNALQILEEQAGASYSPDLDESGFNELVSKFLGLNVDDIRVDAMHNLYSNLQDATEANLAKQADLYSSGYLKIQGILNETVTGFEDVYQKLNEASNPDKLHIDETANELKRLQQAFDENTFEIAFLESANDPSPQMKATLDNLKALNIQYVAEMKELYKDGVQDPEVVRANALITAKEQKDAADALAEDLSKTSDLLTAKLLQNEKEYLSKKKKANKDYANSIIDLTIDTFNEQKRVDALDVSETKLASAQKLLDARKADNDLVGVSAKLAAASLNVHQAKLEIAEDEKAALLVTLEVAEKHLAVVAQQLDSINEEKSTNEDYQKILASILSTRSKLITQDGKLLTLRGKNATILKKVKKEEENLANARDKSAESAAELALEESKLARLRGDESDIGRVNRQNSEQEAFYQAEVARIQARIKALTDEKIALEAKRQAEATAGTLTEEDTSQYKLEDTGLETDIAKQTKLLNDAKKDQAKFSLEIAQTTASQELMIQESLWKAKGENTEAYFTSLDAAAKDGSITFVDAAQRQMEATRTAWQRGEGSLQAYKDALNKVIELHGEVDRSAQVAANGTLGDNLEEGFKKGVSGAQTLNESMQDLAETGVASFASGMTEAFGAMIDGSKSASEAFGDFAKSFLSQIAEMILQQIVLNALKTGLGFASGGQAGGSHQAGTQSFDTGGTVRGSSPTPTADNIPAWLTAGEFVHPVKAVRKYGSAFMESIRTLKFDPKGFAMGGMIGGLDMMPRLAYGGSVPSVAKSTSVNVETGDNNFTIANVIDKNLMGDYLDGVTGEKTMMNFITKNQSAIKGVLR